MHGTKTKNLNGLQLPKKKKEKKKKCKFTKNV